MCTLQALKAEKFEKEVNRFKEKVHELDYYKSRVEVCEELECKLNEFCLFCLAF